MKKVVKIEDKVKEFFARLGEPETEKDSKKKEVNLYNEAGLQYELALYLRKELEADIFLEYPVTELDPKGTKPEDFKFKKKEIDIFIKNPERVVIELKFPRSNAGFPGVIYNAVKDVRFGEQIIDKGKADRFITIFITDHKSVGNGNTNHIYELFNSNYPKACIKSIEIDDTYPKFMQDHNHEGGRYESIELDKKYRFEWTKVTHNEEVFQYYIISSDSNQTSCK
jgi:hypothetical protein